ncbi:MAG: hypothetical protein Q4D30_11295 [Bacteroidales bacterium]|nr:hypothetical protein [Bacteroidales bacterium]
MVNRNLIPIDFQQAGNICLLSSLSVCIGYYKHLQNGANASFRINSLFEKYFNYMKEKNNNDINDRISSIEREKSRGCGRKKYENSIASLLHFYCQNIMNDIRGFSHVAEFDNYLRSNHFRGFPDNYESLLIIANNEPTREILQRILSDITTEQHRLAMIFYNHHSVVLGKGDDDILYVRDTNNSITQEISQDLFTFNNYPISEYILFCVKSN